MAAALYAAALGVAVVALLAHRVYRVRQVRYAQRDAMMAKYAHLVDDMSKMTYHEAEEISKCSSFYVSSTRRKVARTWRATHAEKV